MKICRAARSREVKEKQAAAQAKRKENIQKYRGKNAKKSLMAEKKPAEGNGGGDRTCAGRDDVGFDTCARQLFCQAR